MKAFILILISLFSFHLAHCEEIKQSNILHYKTLQQKYILPPKEFTQVNDQNDATEISIQEITNSSKIISHKRKLVDERPLWSLLNAGDYDGVRNLIHRLQKRYKRWKPPINLLVLLHEKEGMKIINEALRKKEWQFIVDISKNYPELFSFKHPDYMWLLAKAYVEINDEIAAVKLYEDLLQHPDIDIKIATLYKAKDNLKVDLFNNFIARNLSRIDDEKLKEIITNILYDTIVESMLIAYKEEKFQDILDDLFKIEDGIILKRDTGIAMIIAWTYFNVQKYDNALSWFQKIISWDTDNTEAYRGAAIAALKLKKYSDALAFISNQSFDNPENLQIYQDIIYAMAQQTYDNKDYNKTIEILKPIRSERRAKLLTAWSFYNLANHQEATKLFDEAFQIKNDQESANGLALGIAKLKDWKKLRELTQTDSTDNRLIFKKILADAYIDNRLYYTAKEVIGNDHLENYEALEGLFSPSFSFGLLSRMKSGESGTSKLILERVPLIDVELWPQDNHDFEVTISNLILKNGQLSSKTPFGCAQTDTTYKYSLKNSYYDLWEPMISYFNEDYRTIYVELGLTPLNAILPAKPTALLKFNNKEEEINYTVDLHAKPVRESMLSYIGALDPYTGKKWGGVLAYGLSNNIYKKLIDPIGLSASSTIELLDGTNTKDNLHLALQVGLPYNLEKTYFTYLTVGPTFSFDAYEHNANHFTYGYGGYFSPQSLLTFGLSSNFLTKERESFLLKGNISVGLQFKSEKAGAAFAKSCDMINHFRYSSNDTSGMATSLELLGGYILSKSWMINGGIIWRNAPDYKDLTSLLSLTYTWDGRKGLIERDLKSRWIDNMY